MKRYLVLIVLLVSVLTIPTPSANADSARKLIIAEFADWSHRDKDREDRDNPPGLFASTRPPVWAQAADGVAAPEPVSLLLFGTGLLSVVGLRRLFR